MGTVRIINDDRHFNDELASAEEKLVVVDFTASWCGPCQKIAPIFEQLSLKYPKAVFLKVDVDKCADTASTQNVRAMPTFIFYRGRARLDQCKGANPAGLESKIRQFYGSGGDADDADDSLADALPGYVRIADNAYYHIFGMIFLAAVLYYWNKYQLGCGPLDATNTSLTNQKKEFY